MKKKGFTLIELLIVVAIIAILAAIAIPNFLQAQVRAKVARVKADMRTIATGLETYYVDKNKYPGDYTYEAANGITYDHEWRHYKRLEPLTTPIAYMSSIPSDPFAVGSEENGIVDTFAYACNDRGQESPADTWVHVAEVLGLEGRESNLDWYLRSFGPDGDSESAFSDMSVTGSALYDPTNGTTTSGDVVRTNLGQL